MKADDFSFKIPIDLVKSDGNSDEMRIGGYASTPDEDRQGDEIIQKGLDIQDFVNYGYFNYDHDNEKILGYPDRDKCRIDHKGFYVEGLLLKGVELAENLWNIAIALKKSGAPRHLGFSVEGKVLQRNALGKIVKAKVYNVAITSNPVNTNATWEALVKSFTEDYSEVEKSLSAGHGDSNGSPLIPESLDSAFRTLSYVIGDDTEAKQHMEYLKKRLSQKQDITKSELVLYFQITKGLSYADSASLVNKLYENEL